MPRHIWNNVNPPPTGIAKSHLSALENLYGITSNFFSCFGGSSNALTTKSERQIVPDLLPVRLQSGWFTPLIDHRLHETPTPNIRPRHHLQRLGPRQPKMLSRLARSRASICTQCLSKPPTVLQTLPPLHRPRNTYSSTADIINPSDPTPSYRPFNSSDLSTMTTKNNPYRTQKRWPPDFSKLPHKMQFRFERRYRRRTKLKYARPTWMKATKLVQWGLISCMS